MRRLLSPLVLAASLAATNGTSDAAPNLFALGDAMSVQAEKVDIDVNAGAATLSGSVVLTRGDLRVTCPTIDLRFDAASHVTWVRGQDGVAADLRGIHAEGPEVELDIAKHVLEMRGGVRLARGQGWLQAERASIDLGTAKVSLTQVKGSIPVPPRPP